MLQRFCPHAIVLTSFWVILYAVTASAAPPPEAFIPQFRSVQISPDGRHVAAIQPHDGRSALVTYDFASPPAFGGEPVAAIPAGPEVEIGGFTWINDERFLIHAGYPFENLTAYHQRFENFRGTRVVATNIDATETSVFTYFGFGQIDAYLPDNPQEIVLHGVRIAYRLNVYDGTTRELRIGRHPRGRIYADSSGRVRLMREYTNGTFRLHWRSADRNNWSRVFVRRVGDDHYMNIYGLSPDGNDIYLVSNHEGRYGFYRVRPDQDSALERVFLDDRFDAGSLTVDRETGSALYATVLRDTFERVYFDDDFAAFAREVGERIPGGNAVPGHSDDSGERWIIWGGSAGSPPSYYIYDKTTGDYQLFAESYPMLGRNDLARVEPYRYVARDGLEIPSYLTWPSESDGGPYPLVVLPHGGPFSRDSMEFDPLRQLIATRGYLVFQPNYRGSTGYGDEYYRAGWREWGLGMQDDVTDGVRHLVAEGVADPERICIVGWSYGGYAALRGASETPELYQCAIGINGVYDIQQLYNPRSFRFVDAIGGSWDQILGDAQYDSIALRALSPNYQANQITADVLLIASAQDPIARIAQSEIMAEALREASVPHETRFYEEGNHSMAFSSSRLATYEEIVQFLEAHLQ